MRALALVLIFCSLPACRTRRPPSPYVRITAADGRIYYAEHLKALHLSEGIEEDEPGFITFRDLVTRETVKLRNGTYKAELVPRAEVDVRQREYLESPDRPPRARAE